MVRRGFTMLEVTIAAMMGMIVMLAALGVFSALDRGDRMLSRRYKENVGLEVAAGAIERALSTLVMEAGSATNLGGSDAINLGGAPLRGVEGLSGASGRARPILGADLTPGLPGMPDVADAAPGTAGSARLVAGSVSPPQRLELTLALHPVAVEMPVSAVEMEKVEGVERADAMAGDEPLAVRGVFELRPEAPRASEAEGERETTWALWWRPLERRVDDTGVEAFVPSGEGARLATGLLSCRWSVFYEEAWKTSHETGAVLDLPAYVKLQVTTAAGLESDWLFEVGWTIGPEFKSAEVPGGEGDVEDTLNGSDGGEPLGGEVEVDGLPAESAPPQQFKPSSAKQIKHPATKPGTKSGTKQGARPGTNPGTGSGSPPRRPGVPPRAPGGER